MKFNKLGKLTTSISIFLAAQASAQFHFPGVQDQDNYIPPVTHTAFDVKGKIDLRSHGQHPYIRRSGETLVEPSQAKTQAILEANVLIATLSGELCGNRNNDFQSLRDMGGIAVPNNEGKTDLFFYAKSSNNESCFEFTGEAAPTHTVNSVRVPVVHFGNVNKDSSNFTVGFLKRNQVGSVDGVGLTTQQTFSPAQVEGQSISINRNNYTATLTVRSCQFRTGDDVSNNFTAVVIPKENVGGAFRVSYDYEVRVVENNGNCDRSPFDEAKEITIPLFAPSLSDNVNLYSISRENTPANINIILQ